ncbi:MAG: molybdopterin-binding protein, partial [Phycisphaerales bacterium]
LLDLLDREEMRAGRVDVRFLDRLVARGEQTSRRHAELALVRAAIESRGAEILFHRLPQRPGRPMLGAIAGTDARPVPVFGLPGNPLSALTTARRIVLPALAAIAGLALRPPREVTVRAEGELAPAAVWRFQLATLEADGAARLLPFRSSGDLAAAGRSDGFVEFEPNARFEPGRRYAFFAWDS